MRHHRRHHVHRRRRNPFGIGGDELSTVGWAVVGGTLVQVANSKFLPTMSSGPTSYLVKIGLSIAGKYVGDMFNKAAGSGILTGGLVITGLQIVKDYLGPTLGLSAYWGSPFPMPTISDQNGIVRNNPYAMLLPPAPAISQPGMGAGRVRGRTGR